MINSQVYQNLKLVGFLNLQPIREQEGLVELNPVIAIG